MIFVGIDDTDMPDTPGTNQLARKLAKMVSARYRCRRIVRHQLCGHPSIPCTSKNGSASLWFEPIQHHEAGWLWETLSSGMREWYVPGSDPGLCVAATVPDELRAFGRRVQREVVAQEEARTIAAHCGVQLAGLGGTEGGVIGALAAVGLASTQDDGRIVQLEHWEEDLAGIVSVSAVASRGVVVRRESGEQVTTGLVDLVKKLRPNCRAGQIVLTVRPSESPPADWTALKLL